MGVAWRGTAWHAVAWHGVAWRGTAWRGADRKHVEREDDQVKHTDGEAVGDLRRLQPEEAQDSEHQAVEDGCAHHTDRERADERHSWKCPAVEYGAAAELS